ncbi:hypothetical protein FB446DRAFT_715945 [Lentinula raphanica]|nr:hypothetical protein FB446DRAFT_715945 [Lentinula raphanica]
MPSYSDSENEIIDRIARNPHPQRLTRNDDSSSSRESSPDSLRRKNRSLTPISDDGDFQTSPNPEGDTPPPPSEQPVIRQPLGFASAFGASTASSTLNTYQAELPNPTKAKFLPGQTVAPTTKRTKSSGTRTKRPKKKDYGEQTGRFRLSDWANDASAHEPSPAPSSTSTQHPPVASSGANLVLNGDVGGAGYNAMSYMLPTQLPQPNTMYSAHTAAPLPSSPTHSYFSNTRFMNMASTSSPASTVPITSQSPAPMVSTTATQMGPIKAAGKASKSVTKTKQKDRAAAKSNKRNGTRTLDNGSRSSYYRRDYENQVDLEAEVMSTPGAGPSSDHTSHLPPKEKSGQSSSKHSKSSRPASRMVTVLITDVRSGMEDHQLTEVIVPLKDTDPEHPEYGFWANAQEVVQKLQSSPSRIEGPARAYTMRGKYRQIFMRQEADGTFETKPVNISVSSERVLEMVVEKLPLLGELPSPPRIPPDLQPSPESDELSFTPQSHESQDSCKRYRTPSDGEDVSTPDFGRLPVDGHTRSGASLYRRKKRTKVDGEESMNSEADLLFSPSTSENIGRQSIDNDNSAADGRGNDRHGEDQIIKRITHALQVHPTRGLWESLMEVKARLPRVSAYVELYRILQTMFERYEGKFPFQKSRKVKIQKIHILKTLRLLVEDDEPLDLSDPEKVSILCADTLRLLSLYGPEGTRFQDSRVREMLEDQLLLEQGSKPHERFLDLLREIDARWQQEKGHVQHQTGIEVEATASPVHPPRVMASTDDIDHLNMVVDRDSTATVESN